MTNSTNTTKISSIFLAAILVAGTITAVYPSFVIGAQAQSETHYGKDSYKQSYGKDSYKSKDSSTALLKKIKCNNIDVNANGLEITALPPSLSGLLASEAEAGDEGQYGASSYGSGEGSYRSDGQSGSDKDFKFVCINNNNNTVIGGGEEEEPIPEPDLSCEECFAANSTLQTAIIEALSSGLGFTTTFFTVDNEGQLFAEAIVGGAQIDTLEKLCNEIENAAQFLGVPLSDVTVSEFLNFIVGFTSEDSFESSIDELVECLLEKGLIVDREPQPIDSLSANGIDNANVHSQCTGSPLCAKLEQQ